MPYDRMFSLYSLRLEIAKDNIRDTDYIRDFEYTIENMKKIKSNDIGLVSLHADVYSYIVFYEPDNEIIIGILRSKK